MIKSPRNAFSVSENGALTIQASTEAVRYYALVVIGFTILNFGIIWICTILVPPVTIAQYGAWIFIGFVSVASGVTFAVLMLSQKHTFDRATDRFLRRQKVISRTTDIQHLRIYNEHVEGRTVCCLSVMFKARKPYPLGRQPVPGEELKELAHRIATYLGLKVVNET